MVPLPEPVFTLTEYVVPETGVTPMMNAPVISGAVESIKSLNGGRTSTPVTASEKVTVKFTLAALEGFASARMIDETAAGNHPLRRARTHRYPVRCR
jgi:hypothetical protein